MCTRNTPFLDYSACVIPTQSLSPSVLDRVREYTRKIALGLGVVGLVNIQFAVKDDTVFVLEANPRASRTVPFVAKATGIPLAKIAARVMMGRKIHEFPYHENSLTHVAVKEVLLPFNKLPGVDTVLGPEMKSTGEVMGIDYDFGKAYFKACIAANNRLPRSGNVFLSVTDDLKYDILPVARTFVKNGLSIYGTAGTVEFLSKNGIPVNLVRKVQQGSPNVIDMLRNGEVSLIINNFADKQSRQDHMQIMRTAVDYGIPYITTIQAAVAAAEAINSVQVEDLTIEPLHHYIGR